MPGIQARVTLVSADGLPRNNCVNTFAVNDITGDPDYSEIADAFQVFYTDAAPTATNPIGVYINNSIQRTNGLRIELIESPNVLPNAPVYTRTATLPAAGSSSSLFQEAAIVITLDATTPETAHPGRFRGRVYIGPLIAGVQATVNNISRPISGVLNDFAAQMAGMADLLRIGEAPVTRSLAVWSRVDNSFYNVSRGWVDDEFDVQRRRGRERTTRTVWDSA